MKCPDGQAITTKAPSFLIAFLLCLCMEVAAIHTHTHTPLPFPLYGKK